MKEVPKRIQRVNGWYKSRWKEAIRILAETPPLNLDARPDEISPDEWIQLIEQLEQFEPHFE